MPSLRTIARRIRLGYKLSPIQSHVISLGGGLALSELERYLLSQSRRYRIFRVRHYKAARRLDNLLRLGNVAGLSLGMAYQRGRYAEPVFDLLNIRKGGLKGVLAHPYRLGGAVLGAAGLGGLGAYEYSRHHKKHKR